MRRQFFIFAIALAVLTGSLVTAGATLRDRDETLRGYVDPTQDANLPFWTPRLGVNAELTQYDPAELAHQLDLMRQAHVTWVRQFFRWDEIEPAQGIYEWSHYDSIVQPFATIPQLRLVAVLVNTPEWARDEGTATAPPRDPAAFGEFARAFAERYGAAIDYYQIWDEPNLFAAWGDLEPRSANYLALLSTSYTIIHQVDPGATVIAAALAPTTDPGPRNVSDIGYLNDLYDMGAAPYMDAAAAKPYGFSDSPTDRTVANDTLNFSRIVALREIMTAHGDGKKALWASAWGWNSLPADWTGKPSIWGQVTEDERTQYTLAALDRADRELPWIGGMILQQWQPTVPPNDPQWGFALIDPQGNPTPLWTTLAQRPQQTSAANGLYFPANPFAHYAGVWTFGDLGADIGWVQDSQFDFDYQGSDLALLLREDNYVAILYPTVDGQPANAAPHDASGNAFINLESGSLQPELNLVPVANGDSTGEHTLHISADRGWDRWALAGFAVSSGDLAEPFNRQIGVALFTATIAALAAAVTATRFNWSPVKARSAVGWHSLGTAGQIAVSVITSLALMIGMLLTWGDALPSLFRREPVQMGLAILTAGLIYVQIHFAVTVIALIILFVIIYHRLDFGLMLTIFYVPFFLFPVELYRFAFPMSEIMLIVTASAWTLRWLAAWGRNRQSTANYFPLAILKHLTPLDYGVAAWLLLGVISLAWTQYRAPAVTELRTLILEPVLFYLILRTTARDRQTLLHLIDALLIAGILVAVIGLYQFANGDAVITAEEGARRLASVYGSPNNVGLFLGRCIPFLLAFLVVRVDTRRRVFAGIGLAILLLTVVLSLSAGALFIGVPAAVAAVLLLILGRRALIPLIGLAGIGAEGFSIALRFERFARVFDFTGGTNFFRIRVWQSALNMIHDHPITGLGLDQFLYAYRGYYILPDAWEEPNLSHPHNMLLDFWVSLGIFGLLLLFWLQFWFWRRAFMLYRVFRRNDPLIFALIVGTMGSMINLLAHGLVDNAVFVNDLSYVFVLLLGIISNIRAIDANPETVV